MKMKLEQGNVCLEVYWKGLFSALSTTPSPEFTSMNGWAYVGECDAPKNAIDYDEERAIEHVIEQRKLAGVTFEAVRAAHNVRYPQEVERELEEAKKWFE